MRNHTEQALQSARRLWSEMTLPEVLLWRVLRARPMGLKFRWQHPVGSYVADFYRDAARTVIEIDGISHTMGDRPERDPARDNWLEEQGFVVVRIPAAHVLKNADAVVQSIVLLCAAAPPPSALRAATSPEGGGSDRSF
ncbi:hypothetical protein V474_10120 [Novosphingobium barchaimii LL02]|uniref:DUF559 domain-containing protein n=1 Tax=Novosphingobium barchaimii LL02 TaxID=1114963 RepID=A0A0J7Y8A0_9SPHN|nr:DUF559 domain-containing protein [Novosphingobium barchaimii]KMS59543.1 hypothetical protein V474_10120 [Novosphingobium barchaimii LL02]